MEKRYEFDETVLLSAVAMGAPGKRTFFLLIGDQKRWVRTWLEKALLETLALAIDQFLFRLSQESIKVNRVAEDVSLSDKVPPGFPSAELEIDQITLGYEQEKATLNLSVHALGPQRGESAELNCRVTLSQMERLGNQAKAICAAGRPRCALCGGPIEPGGHICPKSN